jgi:hypothetical protein
MMVQTVAPVTAGNAEIQTHWQCLKLKILEHNRTEYNCIPNPKVPFGITLI